MIAITTDQSRYCPLFAKVCEWVAVNQVKGYGEDHRTLKEPLQFAYTKHCSTATALIKVVDSRKSAVDNKKYTVAVFLDFRKAYDIIDHSVLLKRLCDCGFDENAPRWFGSFLTSGQQYVTYQNAQSVIEYITTGVKQDFSVSSQAYFT